MRQLDGGRFRVVTDDGRVLVSHDERELAAFAVYQWNKIRLRYPGEFPRVRLVEPGDGAMHLG